MGNAKKRKYSYNKLLGKIKENGMTMERFAQALGISKTQFSSIIHNKCYFTQDKIDRTISILNIKDEEIQACFFLKK